MSGIGRVHERINADINRVARSLMGVGDDPPFCYSIGNYFQRWTVGPPPGNVVIMPELLVIGTAKGNFLNDLSNMMIEARQPFDDGQVVLMHGARQPVRIIRANNDARTKYMIQAGVILRVNDYPVMQVLIPDTAGKFPGESGCAPPYSLWPVLHERLLQ